MILLHHAIHEGESIDPILVHTFLGTTREQCLSTLAIHAAWDMFLKAAITTGAFPDGRGGLMKLTVIVTWEEVP